MSVKPPNVNGAPAHRPVPSVEIEMRTVTTTPSGRSVTTDTKGAGAGDPVPSHTMVPKEDSPPRMTQEDRISLEKFETRQKAHKARRLEIWTDAHAKSEALVGVLKPSASLPLPQRNALVFEHVAKILQYDKPTERAIAAEAIIGRLNEADVKASERDAACCKIGTLLGLKDKLEAQRKGRELSGMEPPSTYRSGLLSPPELGLRLSCEPAFAFRMNGTAQQKVQWLAIACQNQEGDNWADMARSQIATHAPEVQRADLSVALEALVGSASPKPESKSQSAPALVVLQPAPALPKALLFDIGTGGTPLGAVDEALSTSGMQGALTPDHFSHMIDAVLGDDDFQWVMFDGLSFNVIANPGFAATFNTDAQAAMELLVRKSGGHTMAASHLASMLSHAAMADADNKDKDSRRLSALVDAVLAGAPDASARQATAQRLADALPAWQFQATREALAHCIDTSLQRLAVSESKTKG